MISSTKNDKVRFLKDLSKRKAREAAGVFFAEGYRGVCEAISAHCEIVNIVVSESFVNSSLMGELNALIDSVYGKNTVSESVFLPVSDNVFAYISETEAPQGVGIAVKIEKTTEISGEYLLLLENLQDPGNMGTVIRTADAAGFDGIICMRGCVDVYNPKVLRSTVGSLFHIPVIMRDSPEDTPASVTKELKDKGYNIYAAHPRGGKCCFDEPFSGKCVIVIGNEANGVTKEMLSSCDTLLTIPMPGKSESLNASVAAAIMMYETVRKRRK